RSAAGGVLPEFLHSSCNHPNMPGESCHFIYWDGSIVGRVVISNVDKINWTYPFSLHEEHGIHVAELRDLTALDYLNSCPLDLNSISCAKRYRVHHDKPQ
ncbi:MAG: hypothetical protein OXF20_01510, partial [Gammaproteobacteria bacterium]|nr:hypothetical protein [Gammaproteobacteria bacterium]